MASWLRQVGYARQSVAVKISLWQVSDDGTAVFMQRFWGKIKAGQNHAQALTQTKREFQRGEAGKAYAEPYH